VGTVAYLMLGGVISQWRGDKEALVRRQYFVILMLGATVAIVIFGRLVG
jgi:hypothetical protein